MKAAEPPPMPGDHRSTWFAIALVLFLLAATIAAAVNFGAEAGAW